jgi:hypothetical protein
MVTSDTEELNEDSGPVDPKTPWEIGSITKTFVAVVVLQIPQPTLEGVPRWTKIRMVDLQDSKVDAKVILGVALTLVLR